MHGDQLNQLLEEVASGKLTPEQALLSIKHLPFKDLGYARVDTHRELRQGFAETIYGPGKTAEQIVTVARSLLQNSRRVFATRLSPDKIKTLRAEFPEGFFSEQASLCVLGDLTSREEKLSSYSVAVLSAGTADLPVAEEASLILEYSGVNLSRIFDVGVAGIHRLLDKAETLMKQDCLIVVAGMDGALPSVVGGLVPCPVIAVPTSVGYGANFSGVAPLLTMLNSCASGVAVVNIDNGYGAAMAALRQATIKVS